MLYLSKIDGIVLSEDTIYDLAMGDFNADSSKADHVGNIVHCIRIDLMQYSNKHTVGSRFISNSLYICLRLYISGYIARITFKLSNLLGSCSRMSSLVEEEEEEVVGVGWM